MGTYALTRRFALGFILVFLLVGSGQTSVIHAVNHPVRPPSHPSLSLPLSPLLQGDENWSDRFGQLGVNGTVYAIAVSGSDVYIGGDFTRAGNTVVNGIARWDGSRWNALGSGLGCATSYNCSRVVNTIAVSGSDVYVGGRFDTADGLSAANIARWDGQRWWPLSSGIQGDTPSGSVVVNALAIRGNQVYVGGSFLKAGAVNIRNLARWDGAQWSALEGSGDGVNGAVTALADDGTMLYVGGLFSRIDGVSLNNIARWDGSRWHDLGGGVNEQVAALAARAGRLYVGGRFTEAGGRAIRYLAQWDGVAWTAIGGVIEGLYGSSVWALALDGETLYIGGLFSTVGGVSAEQVARWDGSAWSSLDGGVTCASGLCSSATVRALATQGGQVYIGGVFSDAGGRAANNIAQWDRQVWSSFYTPTSNEVRGAVNAIVVSGSSVYVGGNFSAVGDQPARGLARWDGTRWWPITVGLPGWTLSSVNALAVSGSDLYVAGLFVTAEGRSVSMIARWDGQTWTSLGDVSGPFFSSDKRINALAVKGRQVYIGGYFDTVNGMSARNVAVWDGVHWSPLGEGVSCIDTSWYCSAAVLALAVDGEALYVGGIFTKAGDQAAHNVARWDGAQWSTLGEGIACPNPYGCSISVSALAVSNGHLYVGGNFTRADDKDVNNLARWDGVQWWDVGGGLRCDGSSCYSINVKAIATQGSDVYVGGQFSVAGASHINNLARWDGVRWWPLGSGIGTDQYSSANGVYALALTGSDVYVGGQFLTAGEHVSRNFAHWREVVAPTATPTPAGPPPSNDNFAAAIDVAPGKTVHGSTSGATVESGEPQPCGELGSSVWFRVQPSMPGALVISTSGSAFDTVLAVYQGQSLDALQLVACNDDNGGSFTSLVSVPVVSQHTYYVQLGGYRAAQGAFNLSVTLGGTSTPTPPPSPTGTPPTETPTMTLTPTATSAPPDNDDFIAARLISVPVTEDGTNAAATLEQEEPSPCTDIGRSVWFKVVPSTNGQLIAFTARSDFDTVVAIYQGTSFADLVVLDCDDDGGPHYTSYAVASVNAAQTYWIQLAGYAGEYGHYVLDVDLDTRTPTPSSTPMPSDTPTATGTPPTATPTLTLTPTATVPAPANDAFANPAALSLPGATTGDTQGATLEQGEPQQCGSIGKTVWFKVVPNVTSTLIATTEGSNFDTVLAVYEGGSLATLRALACDDDNGPGTTSEARILVRAGEPYYIQLGGFAAVGGAYRLSILVDTNTPTPTFTATLPLPTRTPSATATESAYPGPVTSTPTLPLPTSTATASPYPFPSVTSTPPANDNFASALALPIPTAIEGDLNGATLELDEPQPCVSTSRTVWYKLTPGSGGRLSLRANFVPLFFNPVLTVYSGASLTGLTRLGCSDEGAAIVIDVTAGETYYLQVSSPGASSGPFSLIVQPVGTATPTLNPYPGPVTSTPTPTIDMTATLAPILTQTALAQTVTALTMTATPTPTPTFTPTSVPTATATPTFTATMTQTPTLTPLLCDPSNPANVCDGSVRITAFIDYGCNVFFNRGTDWPLANLPISIRLTNGQVLTATTDANGEAFISGVVILAGGHAVVSPGDIQPPSWLTAQGLRLTPCGTSPATVTLTSAHFTRDTAIATFRFIPGL